MTQRCHTIKLLHYFSTSSKNRFEPVRHSIVSRTAKLLLVSVLVFSQCRALSKCEEHRYYQCQRGDCWLPGKIKRCTFEAFAAASTLTTYRRPFIRFTLSVSVTFQFSFITLSFISIDLKVKIKIKIVCLYEFCFVLWYKSKD